MALKKVDAVIFDLDNTLYNEEIFYYQYFKIFCKKFNYPFKKFLLMFNISQEIFKVDILKPRLVISETKRSINPVFPESFHPMTPKIFILFLYL